MTSSVAAVGGRVDAMTGFVTLQRKATEHHLFAGDSAKLGAWFWLVAKACWKPTKFNVNGKTITIERGQFCCSVRDLAEAWGWSKSSVDRFLTRLKTETMIGTSAGTGRLIITICNYEKYQDVGSKAGTAGGTRAGQQRDTKEPVNQEPIGSIVVSARRDADWPEIPEWIPAASWNGWLEVRERKRDWPTTRAVELSIKSLTDWRAKGHDPGEILDTSTQRNWTGIFEPKEPRNGNGHRNNHRSSDEPLNPFVRAAAERQAERAAHGEGQSGSWPDHGGGFEGMAGGPPD